MSIPSTPFTVNGRSYNPPAIPIAVICLDGSADDCALFGFFFGSATSATNVIGGSTAESAKGRSATM
jgi:hypothetical protein